MQDFHNRALALLFAISCLLSGATFASAGPYEDALAGFTADSFGDTADAIEALTASGDARTGRSDAVPAAAAAHAGRRG